jgi:hypothetical protein
MDSHESEQLNQLVNDAGWTASASGGIPVSGNRIRSIEWYHFQFPIPCNLSTQLKCAHYRLPIIRQMSPVLPSITRCSSIISSALCVASLYWISIAKNIESDREPPARLQL